MIIGNDEFKYEWVDNWVKIPETESAKENGRTHGIVISEEGNIIIFNQADPAVLEYDPEGRLVNSWGHRFTGAHGLTLTKEDGKEYLWLTDQYSGEVIKTTLSGEEVLIIKKPNLNIYSENEYSPTWAAVFEERFGGNGDIWLSDGYGSNFIHQYNKEGIYLKSINGEKGDAGKFNCPHSIFFDTRKKEPELYVADRGNKRFQVFDPDGNYKRTFGDDVLGCPCGGVIKDKLLYVPELCARIAVLDENDQLITYLGRNEEVCEVPGWPDHEKKFIEPGKFNSPHDIAVDGDDNLYVVEWIKGGRVTKLKRV